MYFTYVVLKHNRYAGGKTDNTPIPHVSSLLVVNTSYLRLLIRFVYRVLHICLQSCKFRFPPTLLTRTWDLEYREGLPRNVLSRHICTIVRTYLVPRLIIYPRLYWMRKKKSSSISIATSNTGVDVLCCSIVKIQTKYLLHRHSYVSAISIMLRATSSGNWQFVRGNFTRQIESVCMLLLGDIERPTA